MSFRPGEMTGGPAILGDFDAVAGAVASVALVPRTISRRWRLNADDLPTIADLAARKRPDTVRVRRGVVLWRPRTTRHGRGLRRRCDVAGAEIQFCPSVAVGAREARDRLSNLRLIV